MKFAVKIWLPRQVFLWAIPGIFFLIFIFSKQLTVNVQYIFCRWLDPNCGPLILEVTALPTEPQPLPKLYRSLYYELLKFDDLSAWAEDRESNFCNIGPHLRKALMHRGEEKSK